MFYTIYWEETLEHANKGMLWPKEFKDKLCNDLTCILGEGKANGLDVVHF